MPTIAFVSPKGGAGKTTSAFLLSTALAKLYDVTVIDADPNHPIKKWADARRPSSVQANWGLATAAHHHHHHHRRQTTPESLGSMWASFPIRASDLQRHSITFVRTGLSPNAHPGLEIVRFAQARNSGEIRSRPDAGTIHT